MRVFAALKLPPEFLRSLRENLRTLRETHPGFRWTGEENLHITLAFLGELDKRGVSLLCETAEMTAQGTGYIPISAGKIITLPRRGPARVLALDIQRGSGEIGALAAFFEENLAARGTGAGYPFREPERRPFAAHVTLARRGSAPLNLPPEERNKIFSAGVTIKALGIFKSDLSRDGPRYTSLAAYPLRASDPPSRI